MSRMIWCDGRFTWWFVGFVALAAGLWLATDIAWRRFVVPIEGFLAAAVVIDLSILALYALAWRRRG